MNSPLIFAHRGAKSQAPENTLPAFQRALDLGVDGIELDVQRCASGELVVIHDFRVDKTTNGTGTVNEMTLAELRALDAGSHFSAYFAGTRIPTLNEVFDLVDGRCTVNVEIKSRNFRDIDEAEPLVELLTQRNLWESVIVSSFNLIALLKVRSLAPQAQLGYLFDEQLPLFLHNALLAPFFDLQAFHPHHTVIEKEGMEWAKTHGLAVNAWTVNEVEEAKRLATLGVNAIITDVPDKLMNREDEE